MTPRIIAVGEEPAPMDDHERPECRPPHRGKPKGKPDSVKTKAGERFAVLNAFVDFALADLNRAEIAVWFVLYRDTRDGTARTSIAELARRAGCDRSTVFRALRRLEARGLVRIVHQGGLGRGVSRYRVKGLPKDG
jgi:predicted transcriptional regulator